MSAERDYVLGTHDEEVERLGLQHRLWRDRAVEGWREAGFAAGQTLLDVGCGPGWATADLSAIAGANGRVVAVDRSRRFLDVLDGRGLGNVDAFEADLDQALPDVTADGAWARWVFAFVTRPKELLKRVRASLKPGARFVIHEYFDYRTWRIVPRSDAFETFVQAVMKSWRANGGEPDIGLTLPLWLEECGFTLHRTRQIVEMITPADALWQWPAAFIESGLSRMTALGSIPPELADDVKRDVAERIASGNTFMTTPAVVEIIATAA